MEAWGNVEREREKHLMQIKMNVGMWDFHENKHLGNVSILCREIKVDHMN